MTTLTIARATYSQTIRQPVYTVLLLAMLATVSIHATLPYYTFGEDTKMYKDIGMAYVLGFVLVMALLSASRVVADEIDDRTMLTLMSKPVRRTEVIIGKFLGLLLGCGLAIFLGCLAVAVAAWFMYPADEMEPIFPEDWRTLEIIRPVQWMHALSIVPGAVTIFLQVAIMTAISVAISTRLGAVLNVVICAVLFVAGNLTGYLQQVVKDAGAGWRALARVLNTLLPGLYQFNITDALAYRTVVFGPVPADEETYFSSISWSTIWTFVGLDALYALCYITAAIALALALFRNRELTGSTA